MIKHDPRQIAFYWGRCLEEVERMFGYPDQQLTPQQQILFDSYKMNMCPLIKYALEHNIDPVLYIKTIEKHITPPQMQTIVKQR